MRVPSAAMLQSHHFRCSRRYLCTVVYRVGKADPVVRSRQVIVGVRQAVHSVEYARRVSPAVQRAIGPTTLTQWEQRPGFQSTFPGVYARTARNWPSGNSALAIANLARPSVVCCGLQNLGLSHQAIVASLFPGLGGALQHLPLVLTPYGVSCRAACLRRTSSA